MEEKHIRHMLQQICEPAFIKDITKRKLTVFSQNSYQDDEYLVTFFYIEGSPPRGYGSVNTRASTYRLVLVNNSHDTPKTYYFDSEGNKITKSRYAMGSFKNPNLRDLARGFPVGAN